MKYTFYFAEGYTGLGFREYLCLGNAGRKEPVEVSLSLQGRNRATGKDLRRSRPCPVHRRRQRRGGPDKDVSIKCESRTSFVAERPLYFAYAGERESWTGGSDAVGPSRTSRPDTSPKGYTGSGFDESGSVLLNPGRRRADLCNFQTKEAGLWYPTGTYKVPAHSRGTFKANDLLQGKSYQTSLKLTSDVPVVVERPMYFDYPAWAPGAGPGATT